MRDAEKDWHERSFRASGAINGYQKYPLAEPEIKFSFFYSWATSSVLFNGLFDIFDPKLNTILSVGISLKYFRRKLLKFE